MVVDWFEGCARSILYYGCLSHLHGTKWGAVMPLPSQMLRCIFDVSMDIFSLYLNPKLDFCFLAVHSSEFSLIVQSRFQPSVIDKRVAFSFLLYFFRLTVKRTKARRLWQVRNKLTLFSMEGGDLDAWSPWPYRNKKCVFVSWNSWKWWPY